MVNKPLTGGVRLASHFHHICQESRSVGRSQRDFLMFWTCWVVVGKNILAVYGKKSELLVQAVLLGS